MQRRTFIKIVGVAGTIGMPLVSCKGIGTVEEVLQMPAFLSGICDEKTLRAIGIAFGHLFPAQYKSELLKKELMSVASSADQLEGGLDPSLLASLLAEKTQTDFDSGQTIVIDGWILSVTEARQCALFSLVSPK